MVDRKLGFPEYFVCLQMRGRKAEKAVVKGKSCSRSTRADLSTTRKAARSRAPSIRFPDDAVMGDTPGRATRMARPRKAPPARARSRLRGRNPSPEVLDQDVDDSNREGSMATDDMRDQDTDWAYQDCQPVDMQAQSTPQVDEGAAAVIQQLRQQGLSQQPQSSQSHEHAQTRPQHSGPVSRTMQGTT